MNLLYFGKYNKRFSEVIKRLRSLPKNTRILELCFGDIYLAEYCKRNNLQWTGLDINESFIQHAQKLGFNAHFGDVSAIKALPETDVCI